MIWFIDTSIIITTYYNSSNQWLPKTWSIPYWATSVFSFAWLSWFWFMSRHFFSFRSPLINTPPLNTELSYDWATTESLFPVRLLIKTTGIHRNCQLSFCCHRNVLTEPLRSKDVFRVGSLLRERVFGELLARNSFPLWLHYSGFQASCHNIHISIFNV